MNLETTRLRISEIEEHHFHEIHQKNSIFEVAESNTIGMPDSIRVTEALIVPLILDKLNEERKRYGWVVRLKDTDDSWRNRDSLIRKTFVVCLRYTLQMFLELRNL